MKPPRYSFWSKILELYGLAWWKVKPVGTKSNKKKGGKAAKGKFLGSNSWQSKGRGFESPQLHFERKNS